jgi:hypothetical protein
MEKPMETPKLTQLIIQKRELDRQLQERIDKGIGVTDLLEPRRELAEQIEREALLYGAAVEFLAK